MSELRGWFKDNQVLVIALLGQAILVGIYQTVCTTLTLFEIPAPH